MPSFKLYNYKFASFKYGNLRIILLHTLASFFFCQISACGAKQVASRCSFRSHAAKPAPLTSPSGSQSTNPGKVNKMILYFKGYNIPVAQFLSEGFSQGFPLNYQGPRQSLFAANLKSPIDNPTAVDVKIPQEINLD